MFTFEHIVDQFGPQVAQQVLQIACGKVNNEIGETKRAANALAEVNHRRSSGVDGIGYCSAEIPAAVYWHWETFKPGFWKCTEDREWFLRKNPQFRTRYQPKARVGYVPVSTTR